ncbi:MAG: hypothetical protein QJR06_05145 [Alicyclobacillaceae bacterium]|nr:hypothetical protein [Alicyclobacillaceae bacterium]
MIYLVIAGVLGLAAWQLAALVRRLRTGNCASGCSECGGRHHCPLSLNDPEPSHKANGLPPSR